MRTLDPALPEDACSAGTARSNIAVEFCWVVEGGGKWSEHEWLNGHFGSSACL